MAATETRAGFAVTGRTVYTYAPEGRNLGVLTGYGHQETFTVEHVIRLPGSPRAMLRPMLQAGLIEAWEAGYERVVFCLPEDDRVRAAPLGRLGLELGFLPYATADGLTWWVRWKP